MIVTTTPATEYIPRKDRSKDPQTEKVTISVNEAGKIDQTVHGDPVVSPSRGDTIEWNCKVEDGGEVEFMVSDFKNACPIDCKHPETPFPKLRQGWVKASETIDSGPLDAKAAGGIYKSTWSVRKKNASGDWEVDDWDPHVIVHGV